MRIWDINPGYLNRQSLLGEHRELHGIVSILVSGKMGYSKHPETIRWISHGWALTMRHQQLAAEMSLRNFTDRTPVGICTNKGVWPEIYIEEPGQQFRILEAKYKGKEKGRIPLPKNAQQLWSQHKYSVMARDVNLYKQIGRNVSKMPSNHDFSDLSKALTEFLRMPPTIGGIKNALQHMWGYISDLSDSKHDIKTWSLNTLYNEIRRCVLESKEPYLMASTALSELKIWINTPCV